MSEFSEGRQGQEYPDQDEAVRWLDLRIAASQQRQKAKDRIIGSGKALPKTPVWAYFEFDNDHETSEQPSIRGSDLFALCVPLGNGSFAIMLVKATSWRLPGSLLTIIEETCIDDDNDCFYRLSVMEHTETGVTNPANAPLIGVDRDGKATMVGELLPYPIWKGIEAIGVDGRLKSTAPYGQYSFLNDAEYNLSKFMELLGEADDLMPDFTSVKP